MEAQPIIRQSRGQTPRRVLVVADWSLDPHAVVAAISTYDRDQPSHYGLLVPAGLHGLAWAGSPNASRPCAERQIARLGQLLFDAGIPVETARVGDPEAGSAISDAVYDWPADEIVLFGRDRRLRVSHPLALARRAERATGLAVTRIGIAARRDRRGFRAAAQCRPLRFGSAG
jgi:hypothetical protein